MEYFENVFKNATRYGLPIWVTEWAVTNWSKDNPVAADKVLSLTKQIVDYLDAQPECEGYSYFSTGPGIDEYLGAPTTMIADDGTLTEIGHYITGK
jgi:hypothetical protein